MTQMGLNLLHKCVYASSARNMYILYIYAGTKEANIQQSKSETAVILHMWTAAETTDVRLFSRSVPLQHRRHTNRDRQVGADPNATCQVSNDKMYVKQKLKDPLVSAYTCVKYCTSLSTVAKKHLQADTPSHQLPLVFIVYLLYEGFLVLLRN